MIIRNEVLRNVITEGRLEDVKSKYPGREAGIDNLSQNDPSGNNKYLAWMVKMVFDQGVSPKHVIDAVKYFHENNVRFTQKDINQYKTLKDLLGAIDVAKSKVTKKEIKEAGVEKIYEDENVIVLHPKTHQASCKYGSDTRWCVTMKHDPSYFRNYSSNGPLFFFIDKRRLPSEPGSPRKNYWKVALHYNLYYCNIIAALEYAMNDKSKMERSISYGGVGKMKVDSEDRKGIFLNYIKNCMMGHADFYNTIDREVRKSTVIKYVPNIDRILESTQKYVLEELGRFYDTYSTYNTEMQEYKRQYDEYSRSKINDVAYVESAIKIRNMSDDLMRMVTMLGGSEMAKELAEYLKKDWATMASEKVSKQKEIKMPERPKTQQPTLKWYDVDLDKRMDDERRKR